MKYCVRENYQTHWFDTASEALSWLSYGILCGYRNVSIVRYYPDARAELLLLHDLPLPSYTRIPPIFTNPS